MKSEYDDIYNVKLKNMKDKTLQKLIGCEYIEEIKNIGFKKQLRY